MYLRYTQQVFEAHFFYVLVSPLFLIPSGEIILQVVRNLAQGLRFLHSSKPAIMHGDLKVGARLPFDKSLDWASNLSLIVLRSNFRPGTFW